MCDDEEWELYKLLIQSGDPYSSNGEIMTPDSITDAQLEDFECVEPTEPNLRVSYSDLPQLVESTQPKNLWYKNELLYHNSPTNEEIQPPPEEIKPQETKSYKRSNPLYLFQNEEPASKQISHEIVSFYFSTNESVDFVLVPYTPENNEEDYSFLGQIPSDVITDIEMIKTMKRYTELAKGAYATNEVSLRERAGLEESQLYYVDFQERAGMYPRPAFYLAVDNTLQALILSIRGTKTALEFQIDAKWKPIEFPQLPGSFVHEGIFFAARWFVDNVLGRLVKLSELFPNHNVRIVGHSLGGGIAALFTLMIKDVIPSAKSVIFAPPACVSANLLPICAECCVSFVNRTDILPYLTHANFKSFFSGKRVIDKNNIVELVDKIVQENDPSTKYQINQETTLIQMYPPGVLHHIFKSLEGTFHIREVPNDHFMNQGFAISRTMIRHHKLDSYKNAFYQM